MPSLKMLKDCVTLFNYVGEENMVAKYQKTILRNVFCVESFGVRESVQGDSSNNSATLYIFDTKVVAESGTGVQKQYLPFSEWKNRSDREEYWTLRNDEKDFFVKGCCENDSPRGVAGVHAITKSVHYDSGTSRMWHWEINGR